MSADLLRKLVPALAVVLFATAGAQAPAAVDGSDLLRSLGASSAASIVSQYPTEARDLALDLVFYRWACSRYGADPGIDGLDRSVTQLVAAQSDPTLKWAATEFVRPEGSPPPEGDQRAKSLSDARQSIDAAVEKASAYPTRSIEHLISCAAILNDINLKLSWAFITEKLAERQFYSVRRYRDARINYERAYPVLSAYGLRDQVAKALDDLGRLESEMGRYPAANKDYIDSANEWRALGRGDLAGRQFVSAGVMLVKDGKATTGLWTMATGLELARGYADAKKSYDALVEMLVSVSGYHGEAGDRETQRKLLDEAEASAKLSGDALLLAGVMKEQAAVWQAMNLEPRVRERMSERDKVLQALAQQGVDAAAKLALTMPASEQIPLLKTAEAGAEASRLLGRYQQGIDTLSRAVIFYQGLGRENDRIRALRALATNYDGAGSRSEALSTRILAAGAAKIIDNPALVVEILRDIEQSALDARDTGTAVDALRESVQVMDAAGSRIALADLLEARGLLLARIGLTPEAISDLKKSVAIYTAEIGEPWTQARVLEKLAELQLASGSASDSVASLASAAGRIEQWSDEEGVDPDAEPSHAGTLKRIVLQLVPMQVKQGLKSEAVRQVNDAKARAWYGDLRTALGAMAEPLAREVLEATQGSDNGTANPPGVVRKVATGWQAVLAQVPQFSRMARAGRDGGPAGPVDAADIFMLRERLPLDLAVVSYYLTDSTALVLIAGRRGADCWELPVDRERIRVATRKFRAAVREYEGRIALGVPVAPVKSWTDPAVLPIVQPLLDISGAVFEPVAGELAKVKTIAFALPDELAGVPFHALPRDAAGTYRFLVQTHEVCYVAPGGLRALADTHPGSLNPKTCRVGVFYDSSGTLPGAAAEKNLIKSIYKSSVSFTGYAASAERFVATASSCNVLHIAAHHQADPNPSKFSITLAKGPGDRWTVELDDMLRISNPNLQLAVLSSCETIGSSDAEAFGASYAAGVFTLAGFPSTVGGLWRISDDASRSLMSTFYRLLASNAGRRAEALRRAQLSMLQSKDGRYANPFYWAGFALYGDPR